MKPAPTRHPRWKLWLVVVLVLAVALSIGAALQHAGAEARARVTAADPDWLLLALGLCILYRIVNSTGWVLVLRSLGHAMPLARGARIWIMAETMRWLPGSVWGFCSRVYQAGKAGAPPAVAAASLPLELVLTIAAWAITAGGAGLAFGLVFDWMKLTSPLALTVLGGALALFAAGAGLVSRHFPRLRLPRKITAFLEQLGTLAKTRPRVAPLVSALLLYTALCALNGLAFHCVLRALTGAPLSLVAAIGANACGWLAGFFAIGVPGGIGVREAGSAMVLATVVPIETAVAAAVLWRLVLIADELCCLGVLLAPTAWARFAEGVRRAFSTATEVHQPQQ
ncbi:MAG: flippase-like domain-containing protein [Chthoniobacter sp.]|nr:flippase-like domain-containing protein [Chthoniobacter sp.]